MKLQRSPCFPDFCNWCLIFPTKVEDNNPSWVQSQGLMAGCLPNVCSSLTPGPVAGWCFPASLGVTRTWVTRSESWAEVMCVTLWLRLYLLTWDPWGGPLFSLGWQLAVLRVVAVPSSSVPIWLRCADAPAPIVDKQWRKYNSHFVYFWVFFFFFWFVCLFYGHTCGIWKFLG